MRERTPIAVAVALAAVLALAACAEKEQVAGQHKPEGKAWQTGNEAFVAKGFKAGDEASWNEQLRRRTQDGQNEYSRAAAGS